MIPNFTFLDKQISPYLICVVTGILVVLIALYIMARRARLDDIDMMFIMLYAFVGVALGGCLLYGLTNWKYILLLFRNYDKIPSFGEFLRLLFPAFQGSVFYGGLIGAVWRCVCTAKGKISAEDIPTLRPSAFRCSMCSEGSVAF